MNDACVVVTGAAGGIGTALNKHLSSAGYQVLNVDHVEPPQKDLDFVDLDLVEFCHNQTYRNQKKEALLQWIGKRRLHLINNAATQILGNVAELSDQDFTRSFQVNALGPYLLTQGMLSALQGGTVINILSIHSRVTKPKFSAYAASKAALESMTRSLALELSGQTNVFGISPAAIETEMLKAGFVGKEEKLAELAAHHPAGALGQPSEIAQLVEFLLKRTGSFLSGSVIPITGAIDGVLHDPDCIF